MNVLLVGQAPPRKAQPGYRPLSGRGGLRLARLVGLELPAFLERVDTANIFDTFPGRAGKKGDAFDIRAARAAASAVPVDGRRVIYLGRDVARAFGQKGDVEYLVPLTDARAQAAWCLPHPSGINQWWNKPGNVAAARTFLRAVLGLDDVEHVKE